jgi:nitroreductase
MHDLTTAMAEAARLAPSIHNSQPWRFVADGDRLDVLTDPARSTPAIDPLGRSMWLSCGAAVLNALVTARAAGRACAVSLGPTRNEPQLVATLTLGGRIAPAGEDHDLAHAVSRRHTVRTPFDRTPVPADVVRRLRYAVEGEHAWLAVVTRADEVVELAVLTGHAEAAENADDAYRDELSSWLRAAGADASDGIPLSLVEPGHAHSSVPLRSFVDAEAAVADDEDAPPPVERPLLAVIGTDGDQQVDWTRAGMAMQRLWLTATAEGLSASPMTQALDHAAFRARLSSVVGLENGHPQMLLRIGYGQQAESTGRRPMSDVLVHH